MNEESNGKICELCKVAIAKPERYAGTTWLCDGCTPTKKHETIKVVGKTKDGSGFTSWRSCRCFECQPNLAPPPEGTACCNDRCDKSATIYAAWGEPYCRECMWAADAKASNPNTSGTLEKVVDDVVENRYHYE